MQHDTPDRHHLELFHQMADAAGLDLEVEFLSGRLTLNDLTSAIERCKNCSGPTACEAWLAQSSVSVPQSPPSYCRNSSMLNIQRIMSKLKPK